MATAHDRTDLVEGHLVEVDGIEWYRIEHLEQMDPFLTAVVSDDDLWAFVSTAGTLTAGRVDADHAVLPYETDDRLHRAAGRTGPVTVVVRDVDGDRQVWRPYGAELDDHCTRALQREVTGTAMTLEETNAEWGLTYRVTWAASRAFGWVRSVELVDDGGSGAEVTVLDGVVGVVPSGVDAKTLQTTSNLVDAYRRSETGPWGSAAVYALESLITDMAEPAEALTATLVWSAGLPDATVHLDERVVEDLVRGRDPRAAVRLLTGRRASYLLHQSDLAVPAGGTARWTVVVDGGLGHAALHERIATARQDGVVADVDRDVAAGAERIRSMVADADGGHRTADPIADAHHRSNVLFNAMRGGVFPYGHDVPTADFRSFVATRDRRVAERCAGLLDDLPERIDVTRLRDRIDDHGDADLRRQLLAYLPLTFSRRHGDPSRPWNRFSIRVRDDQGGELLTYEGNWRDIFQNWEALLRSYPAWYGHVVATFVNASTVDGYNPYRISRDGIDWEVPDEDDPWANIGYWGDHQLVYLMRLVEDWLAVDPTAADDWLQAPLFTYADVPYDLAGHDRMIARPRDTVDYDEERAAAIAERVADVGADGRLVVDADGQLVRVGLLEKLLVPALAKLSALVAGGGIWMNTQRPEWNDANNALAGFGLSMVTLQHLAQYVEVVRGLLSRIEGEVTLSSPVASWLADVTGALAADPVRARDDDRARRSLLDALGRAAADHRAAVGTSAAADTTSTFDPTPTAVERRLVEELLDRAAAHLEATIATARRDDGLFQSYSLVDFPDDGTATVEHLQPMLEGQVAAVASPVLDDDEVVALVDAVYASELHRPDIDTLLLYPAITRTPFLERNEVPADRADAADLPDVLTSRGAASILQRSPDGALHFRGDLANADDLAAALDEVAVTGDAAARVLALYEQTFDHHAFTGRSLAMHGYEGIGSVYWHMVSKLLVAVGERHTAAARAGASADTLDALAAAYRRVRDGLGFRMDPATFGAIPTDCYSHTPAHAGAQQPGMTGQVKEQVVARLAELGLAVADGRLEVLPSPLTGFDLVDADDDARATWTASVCATPVHITPGDDPTATVVTSDGQRHTEPGNRLSRDHTTALLGRTGAIHAVEFTTARSVG